MCRLQAFLRKGVKLRSGHHRKHQVEQRELHVLWGKNRINRHREEKETLMAKRRTIMQADAQSEAKQKQSATTPLHISPLTLMR